MPPGQREPQRVRRLLELLRPHRLRFAAASAALLLGSAIGLVYPQAVRLAVDTGVGAASTARLDAIGLGLLLLFTVQGGLTWTRHYLMSWLGERAVADLRRRVFDRALLLPPSWFHERNTGELVGRLASDVAIVEGVVGTELSMAMRNAVQLVGGIALLFVENARLTLIILAVVPPLSVTVVLFGRRIRAMSRRVQDELARTSGRVQEALGAMVTVQAFTRERYESERYGEGVEEAFARALELARWRASFMTTASVAGYLAVACIVWVGGRFVIAGQMTPGSLTAFLLYTGIVAVAVGSLTGLYGSLQRAAGATDRLFELIETVPEIRNPTAPTPLPPGGGEVSFEAVRFAYASRPDHPVLRGVDLKVAAGETLALVGPSGGGKTTLTSLVPRFYDPVEGVVRVDGVDVRALDLSELRGAIAMVPQDPVLFSGTIAENIAYGREGASAAEIEAAARDANAHDFVESFPDGYATWVGERGVQLSGGQRQRVAIARALLADPRILILDEATSNLDAQSEALVQAALDRLMHDRTTLVIAHRLSTVKDADRIAVLVEGEVVEVGTHEALMERGAVYRSLVEHQLLGGAETR